jgi:hypothetical protein
LREDRGAKRRRRRRRSEKRARVKTKGDASG